MKTYVTFGFDHVHSVNGIIFDRNCVACILSESSSVGRKLAFEYFGPKFSFEYAEQHFDFSSIDKYFPRGIINVNF